MKKYLCMTMDGLIDRIGELGMGDDYWMGFTEEGEWEFHFVKWWAKREFRRYRIGWIHIGKRIAYDRACLAFRRPYKTASYDLICQVAMEDLQ